MDETYLRVAGKVSANAGTNVRATGDVDKDGKNICRHCNIDRVKHWTGMRVSKVLGVLILATVVVGVIANLPDIKRYIIFVAVSPNASWSNLDDDLHARAQ